MTEDILETLGFGTRSLMKLAGWFGIELDLKKSKAPIAEYLFDISPKKAKIRKPKWDYVQLYDAAIKSWVFRQIARAIIQEVIVPESMLIKKFTHKCVVCGTEYDYEEKQCKICGGIEFRKPDISQRKIAQTLIDSPNPDYSFKELMRSALFWHIMLDDTYLSIAYKTVVKNSQIIRQPSDVYVEDSRFTFPVADAKGQYGNNEYFCPKCYNPEIDNYTIAEPDKPAPTKCPDCGGLLLQTCYVMELGGKIKQRFGKDEVIQGSTDRLLPNLFGNPKIISVYKQLCTINNMDDYNEEVTMEGGVGGFIAFPGMTESEVTEMKKKIQKEVNTRNKKDVTTGKRQTSKKIHHLMIGVKDKPPVFIGAMPNPADMQSFEFYTLYRDSMCSVFGVTPIFVSVIESGKSGNNPRMQIDVQKGTTQENQQFLSDLWNDKVFPVFGVLDWEIQFGSIELVDELREAQVWEHKANAAKMLTGIGFEVTFDEHNNLEVSGEPKEGFEPPPGESTEPMADEVSPESGDWPPESPTKKKGKPDTPPEAQAIREEMEKEFLKILNNARKLGDAKASYAQAKKVMDGIFKRTIECARSSLEFTLKRDLPELPKDVLTKLKAIRNERMRDFRKLLKDELKREEEKKK